MQRCKALSRWASMTVVPPLKHTPACCAEYQQALVKAHKELQAVRQQLIAVNKQLQFTKLREYQKGRSNPHLDLNHHTPHTYH